MVLLLHSGRCYEAEICVILLLMAWTIIRHFEQMSLCTHISSLTMLCVLSTGCDRLKGKVNGQSFVVLYILFSFIS